jgi:hypothetical protein
MPLSFKSLGESGAMHRLTSDTYSNADGTKVVAETSPDVAFFVGLAGDEIPLERAERLGLVNAKARSEPPEDKAIKAPPATKARRRASRSK